MYRKEKKIPTILALFLLIAGLGASVILDKSSQSLITRAGRSIQPEDVHFSNISENSFVVSWITTDPTIGSITVSSDQQKFTYLDDLDRDNIPRPRTTHFITIKNLVEVTTYNVKIISGNQNCDNSIYCPTYTQQTAAKLESNISLPPAHGTIVTRNDIPADTSIIYLTIGKSAPLSSRVDSSGLWVIPLTNLRNQDLITRPVIADNDIIQITTQLSPNEVAGAVIDVKSIKQNLTIPKITLGNSYNFIDLVSKKDLLAQSQQNDIQQNVLGVTTEGKLDVLFPKNDGDSTPDNQPRLRGTGQPGSQLLIIVNSTPQSGKVTVGDDGTWSWRPPKVLEAGIHNLSIQGNDDNGNLITVTRKFIILKSGEAVLGESTPSASLTPSPIISPSPTLNLTPIISQTVSPTTVPTSAPITTPIPTSTEIPTRPPTSGVAGITLILVGIGLAFILSAKLIPFLP